MNFTFGVITGGGQEERINHIIDTIEREKIGDYEVLIVGACNIKRARTEIIPFDESRRPMWITHKKNLVTDCARFFNIVYMHDYLALEPGWYDGWMNFVATNKWNPLTVGMNRILNADGTRFRDWCLWDMEPFHGVNPRARMLPYDVTHLSRYMYFSGAYWVATKPIMQLFPLNENLSWGQGEDVEWSQRIRQHHNFIINPNSAVKIIKDQKDPAFIEMNEQEIAIVKAKT